LLELLAQLERARRQRHEAGERPAAIGVEPDMVEEGVPLGVDTPHDLERARAVLAARRLN
jgi:3-deoxy-manno-octulosonate cytidylyltransferase (CMP-KDO synthetase)